MRISDWSSDVCSSDLDVDGQVETLAHQRRAHRVLAALVELVQFAQHRQLAVAVDALALEEAAQQLAVVEPDGEFADCQCVEHRRDHRRDLGVMARRQRVLRSEEHTSELQSLMRISYAVFCLKKKTNKTIN